DEVQAEFLAAGRSLLSICGLTCGFLAAVAIVAVTRKLLLAGRPKSESSTWDCGYAQPSARMQYTASSFARPLTDLFACILRGRKTGVLIKGFFPKAGSLHTETPDLFHEWLYAPVFRSLIWGFSRLRWLQHGRVQLYVLYVALALLALLLWKLRA
ncbi:hypothetical protein JW933_02640, partial [candidate division FCPU426 bacterium]|nr:hypothetical protein [candidate division FCPU426 bacterium]